MFAAVPATSAFGLGWLPIPNDEGSLTTVSGSEWIGSTRLVSWRYSRNDGFYSLLLTQIVILIYRQSISKLVRSFTTVSHPWEDGGTDKWRLSTMYVKRAIRRLSTQTTTATLRAAIGRQFVLSAVLLTIAVDPALAQTTTAAFCDTMMVKTIKNLFTVIQLGGPLLGGVIALGATVVVPTVRRADIKKEIKEIRNQGLVWGIIVAPLGMAIIKFLLNDVVAGGTSCGF